MNQPLAYIHPSAKIADNVVIEPFSVIGKSVVIEEGTWIGPNVNIFDGAKIGKNCKIYPGASISAVPQDLKLMLSLRITVSISVPSKSHVPLGGQTLSSPEAVVL